MHRKPNLEVEMSMVSVAETMSSRWINIGVQTEVAFPSVLIA